MRLNRGRVGRLERPRRARRAPSRRRRCFATTASSRLARLADVRVELVHRRQPGPVRPLHLQLLRGLDRVPFALGDDAEEVLQAYDPGAVRRLPVAEQLRAEPRRPDHAAVQHPRHANVLDVEVLARHLGRDVDARHRLADDRVLARGLRLRPAEREPEPAGLALDRNRDAEQATVDELAVRDSPRSVASQADDSVLDGELACRDTELRRRQVEQRLPPVGCSLPKLRAGKGDRQAAHGRSLVDACSRCRP